MRSTLDELQTELDELRALVASIGPVNRALANHHDSLVRRYVLVRRRFDDAAFTVALYASFEKFTENLVAAFARLEARRLAYVDLPASLQRKHVSKTAEILLRGRIGEGRYAGLTERDLVKNLCECLNGGRPYALNDAALMAHDRNLRAPEVDSLFAAIGIEVVCDGVRRADALLDWYCRAKQLDVLPSEGVPRATVEEQLRDIVDRRNQVAHRGGNPDDLLGADKMLDAIRFIEAFSVSIFALVVGRYLERNHAGHGIQLIQRQGDGPYNKGTCVIVEHPAQRLRVGQAVFVLGGAFCARWGRIQSMKLDDVAVDFVEAETAVTNGIGIAVDFRCPKGARLVVLAGEDDLVWTPLSAVPAPVEPWSVTPG